MDKERPCLVASLCLSLWLFCAYIYFDMPRFTIPARPDPKPTVIPFGHGFNGQSNTTTTSIKNITESNQEGSFSGEPFVTVDDKSDPCDGRYIYVHDLPRKFNEAILEDCEHLIKRINMCRHLENGGFGPKLDDPEGIFSKTGWYDTNQFTLEVIFNTRMKQYDCLTRNSSLAAAIYVPFYGGFDFSRHIEYLTSIQLRDELAIEFANWVRNTKEWDIMGGMDHFMVLGRITWEFRRWTDNVTKYGNKLLLLPEVKNMTSIMIEAKPWDSNDFAIPYPTYFHPSRDDEVLIWQDRMRKVKREWLFSFAGAPRLWDPVSNRNPVFNQCKNSDACKLYECAHEGNICSPANTMRLFQNSFFCLQPSGDSPTRRSTFDSMLAGCIPVFFRPAAAYVQYIWYLPKNYTKYSVYIPEDDILKKNVSIEETLRQISPQRVEEMREQVIDLIPKIIYADPNSKSRTFKDAFDIAIEAVIERVTRLKHEHLGG